MKRTAIMISAGLVFLVLFMTSALAATTVTTNSPLTIGGPNQDASNPEHDDGPKAETNTGTITFTSSDPTVTITQVTFDIQDFQTQAVSGFSLDKSLDFSNMNTIESKLTSNLLVVDAVDFTGNAPSATVLVTGLIPASLDAVDSNLNEKSFKVATLAFTVDLSDSTQQQVTVELFMQRKNMLEIKDLEVEINNRDRQNIDEDDDVDGLKPGDKLEFEVEVESLFDDKDEVDIEDVDVEYECDDEEDFDIDDATQDVGDMSPEDEQIESFLVDIENDAEDGDTSCQFKTTGVDENGASHGHQLNFNIEIERKSHDIQIQTASIVPAVLSCEDTNMQLTVDVVNLGRSDDDDIVIEVSSKTLGLLERLGNIGLDEDDTLSETFSLSVDPTTLNPGVYALQVQTFYDTTKNSDTEIVQVENLCGEFTGESPIDEGDGGFATRKGSLSLDKSTVSAGLGDSISLAVEMTNELNTPETFTLEVENLEEFAQPVASKQYDLAPGQTLKVFVNVRTSEDAEAGKYSATVKLRDSAGNTVQTETVTVDLGGESASRGAGFNFNFRNTNTLYIIANVILFLLAIFFIKLIFTGGRKKKASEPAPAKKMKMADFEAKAKRK